MTETSAAGRLPDFLVIGAPKCGTHWLHECLREHPEVYLTPGVHEVFFFDRYRLHPVRSIDPHGRRRSERGAGRVERDGAGRGRLPGKR